MELYNILILSSFIIIASYVFNILSKAFKIPSVLLLIFTGVALRYLTSYLNIEFFIPNLVLEIMGTLGLILIVLEGSLDLKLSKEEYPLLKKASLAALVILLASIFSIAFVINLSLNASFKQSLITAIPLAVISSAIAIPSVQYMSKKIRNFIIYEATFSDILGILFFNYLIQDSILNFHTIKNFGISIFVIFLISLAGSLLLIFIMNRISAHVKFFLILAILLLIYAIGKKLHLPSLLLILIFGLMINNPAKFIRGRIEKFFEHDKMREDLQPLKLFTAETAFLIRTFFFIIFGYNIEITNLFDLDILIPGSIIIIISLIIRYVYLRFTVDAKDQIIKLFIAPKGLISILLFYSIPAKYVIPEFSEGILVFVIIASGLMMIISLLWSDKESDVKTENSI